MSQSPPFSSPSTPLQGALRQNKATKDMVEQSAAELVMINAVLKQEVPSHLQTGEVAQALQKADELEDRLEASTEDLQQVNETLKQEIGERVRLEAELAATKMNLVRSQANAS